ncbi:MAG: ATP-dependent Clp protease proteolytic subunit [Ornithinibacter sp.]
MYPEITGRLAVPGPSSRYIMPQFEERTSYGMKRMDPYTKLFEDRIIFLGVQVDDASADDVIAQLIVLESQDPDRDILLYINSPGGSVTAGMAIFDTMQWVPNDVATVAMGMAASMGQFLLSAGTPGKRHVTPHARVMMHQPSGGIGGTASDIKIQAEQLLHIKKQMAELIAEHTGQSIEQIEEDSDRDRWFTAEEAKAYGFVDHVFSRAAQSANTDNPVTD